MRAILTICLLIFCGTAFATGDCTKDGAYAAGFNDEQRGFPMQQNYAQRCLGGDTAKLNYAYIKGYTAAAQINHGSSAPAQQCVNYFGKQVCGYNCISTPAGAQCAPTPDQTCAKDNFNDIACGYGCASSGLNVKCASEPGESCLADNFGNVVCGKNCRLQYGQAECDN